MTERQIKLAQTNLCNIIKSLCNGEICGWVKKLSETNIELVKELNRQQAELDCRDMINSCLCYGSDFYRPQNRWICGEGYRTLSYAEKYAEKVGGMDRVDEIYREQEIDFQQAIVKRNVFTDSEGLTYNSIQWADEQ